MTPEQKKIVGNNLKRLIFKYKEEGRFKTNKDAADFLGIDRTTLSTIFTGKKRISVERVNLWSQKFNSNLFEEDRAEYSTEPSAHHNTYLVPVQVEAGSLSGIGTPVFESTLEGYRIPGFTGKGYVFQVSGLSMVPELYDTDMVVASIVDDPENIQDGYINVICHREGYLVKRIFRKREVHMVVVNFYSIKAKGFHNLTSQF